MPWDNYLNAGLEIKTFFSLKDEGELKYILTYMWDYTVRYVLR